MVLALLVLILVLVLVDQRLRSPPWREYPDNSVALVTGGSHGLGKEIVEDLLRRGIRRVLILDRDAPAHLNDQRRFYECDLANAAQVTRCMAQILADLQQEDLVISILINNAGVRFNGPLLETEISSLETGFQVNVFSPLYIAQRVMRQHFENSGTQLYVVTVSLILAALAPANLLVYASSKAALWLAHEALLIEVAAHKNTTRLLLVASGQLDTRMFGDVKPSNQFFAPMISHVDLARRITASVFSGRQGVLYLPFYANFLPAVRCMPYSWQQLARHVSGMDVCIN